MADAVREQAWQHTARIAWAAVFPHVKRTVNPDEFNEYRLAKKALRLETLAAQAPASKLPDNPSDAQIEDAWQEFKRWQDQAQAP